VAGRVRRKDEQGAVAVFVAIVLTLLMVASAFAVDLGMQRAARADMQAVADAVAIDLARELDGRTATQLGTLQAAANASRDRNKSTTLGSVPVVTPELGVVNRATGVFTPVSGGTVPNAVRVTATTSV
jgi:Flp pilus assembly protein TadG